jgi:hypothetical protein
MPPTLNRKPATFVLSKIDEILAREKQNGTHGLWIWAGICAKSGRDGGRRDWNWPSSRAGKGRGAEECGSMKRLGIHHIQFRSRSRDDHESNLINAVRDLSQKAHAMS